MKLKGFPADDEEKAKQIAAKEKFAKIMDRESEKAAAKAAGQHFGRLSRLQAEVLKNSPPPVKSLQSLQRKKINQIQTLMQVKVPRPRKKKARLVRKKPR